MLFDSPIFVYAFLPLTVLLYYWTLRFRLLAFSRILLLAFSLFFYVYSAEKFLSLLLVSVAGNYVFARLIHARRFSRLFLTLGITLDLGVLGYFKYCNFFMQNLSGIFSVHWQAVSLALPLGISFYTFQQIAYLADVYQRKTEPHQLYDYALFVVFFPQFIAGPIVHYSKVMNQFSSLRTKVASHKNLFSGCFYFAVGFFQKLVFADFWISIVNRAFEQSGNLSFLDAWAAALAFTIQIYFDFAGYSNMAIGLGLFFNIRLPQNFNSPYKAVSIVDFWRRWHITLSEFLRDYLYIPLGGNRAGEWRRQMNILATMFLGGLWHGASWTFVLWGVYHGILIVICHIAEKFKISFPRGFGRPVTFILVVYGWVLFKAKSFAQVTLFSKSLFNFSAGSGSVLFTRMQWECLAILLAGVFLVPNARELEKRLKPDFNWCLLISVLFLIAFNFMMNSDVPTEFIYWKF